MMRQRVPAFRVESEDAGREPADGARHAIAIKIERRPVGRTQIGVHIHRHAVDHGAEIVAPQTEAADRFFEVGGGGQDLAVEQPVDILAPALQRGMARGTRRVAVGDVVHRAAESVDRVHRVPLGGRQDTHGGIEGAARRRQSRGRFRRLRRRLIRHGRHYRPLVSAGRTGKRAAQERAPDKRSARRHQRDHQKPGLSMMHLLAQRIAMAQA